MSNVAELARLVEAGENVKAVAEAERLFLSGVSVQNILTEGLVAALRALSHKCTTENFQLLDVLLASRAMVEVIDQVVAQEIENGMDRIAAMHEARMDGDNCKKTLVIGTIEGDVHDLGKHLVATVSRISGIRVVNLGKDVPPQAFVDAAVRERAHIIGVSSLMTVCLPSINKIRPLAEKSGISPVIVAGGAAAQQVEKGYLDVDYVAFDVFDGLNYFTKLPYLS
ncbi:MAG: cobalamin B12-binding domain-containing protein [Deltaproteobacteria bacterium]|nr:cobalamin B12-binding domain-containing protein [Deltaproteobacteria bacterium]